jgi:hypothetical protein
MRREYREARDEKLQALSSELWRARHTIVNLMPPDITGVLQSYYRCDTLEQRDAWHRKCRGHPDFPGLAKREATH